MSVDFDPDVPVEEYTLDDLLGMAEKAGPTYRKVIEEAVSSVHDACHEKLRNIAYEYIVDLYRRGLLFPCIHRYVEEMSHLVQKIIECGGDPHVVFAKAMDYDTGYEAETEEAPCGEECHEDSHYAKVSRYTTI